MGASYVMQKDRNMTNQGTYNNPLVGAYVYPRGNDWPISKCTSVTIPPAASIPSTGP